MSTCLPLNVNAVLRAITESAETLLRSVITSSLMPSLKYSCSASPLMLENGSTQMPTAAGFAAGASAAADSTAAPADEAGREVIAVSERSRSWNGGLAGSSPQPSRSVAWIARTSIGMRAPSKRTGTRTPRSAASRASPRTQRDPVDAGVQTTSTALAALSSASMRSSNSWPATMAWSHQTDQPFASRARTIGVTRARSLRA